jgi:sulfofructose kinase
MKQPWIVSLGIAVLDRTWTVERIPDRPVKVTASGFRESGGGMAANAAVTIAALGGRAALWSRLGDDAAGRWLLGELARRGVATDGVRVFAGGATACSAILVDGSGERMLGVFRGRGLPADPSGLPLDRLEDAAAVMADNRWVEGAAALFDAAGRRGIPRILDGDVGEPEALTALAGRAEHVIFSAGGLAQFSGVEGDDGLHRAAEQVRGVVGVTRGAGGFAWLENGALRHAPAFCIAARDTTGAGDAFHAAYALAIARGESVAQAARFANAAAAIKCAKGEGWDGLPTEREVRLMMEEQS